MNEVRLSALRLGQLVAEGGEGRVFDVVAGPPELGARPVYKQFRHPRPLPELRSLVTFPSLLASEDQALTARVRSSSAWPVASVVGDDPALALGTVMPRAPAEFWLRHRDGTSRLATLSYMAGDPDRIAVAYGALMPPPGAAERVALVYALARLLVAWQSQPPSPGAVHGDLSGKNILWSLQPAPAVYVLDCDGASVRCGPDDEVDDEVDYEGSDVGSDVGPGSPGRATRAGSRLGWDDGGGEGAHLRRRSRAITPNWDDPALHPGDPPTQASDRYMLGITFLRVVGAAHFPLQGRQRAADKVNVDLELPRSWRKLPDVPVLWELCERSLSVVDAGGRPSPAEWAAELEQLLEVLSAQALATAVRVAQGDPRPAMSPGVPATRGDRRKLAAVTVPDVTVRPVLRRRPPSTWQLINAASPPLGGPGDPLDGGRGGSSGTWWAGRGSAITAPLTPRQVGRRVLATWGGAHRVAVGWARSPGRRAYGVRRLARVLVLDLAAAAVALFVVAMLVSPWIGL